MPGFDGTGPRGTGSMTGRGLGPCGRGLRRGFGCRIAYPITLSKEEQKKMLEQDLEEIKKRLKELE